ncbi:Carboxylic ester hydrolase [Methylocella tundrae]|uniref:Carboxylic ester hydrolase n=1 Tax=Methylocella tundrae TaxID=227605 RepID=A0A8B6MBC1_METTU|nr:carboxylesterase family protein [Methylocella tundrae]VTZ52202.1 Carboxylic ester hydrolase [Methylocella tundrae]
MSKLSKLWRRPRSRADTSRASGAGFALSLLFATSAALTPLQADAAGKLRVETKEGPVKGFLNNGVAEFLGIPYAAPPIGNLRWRPPQKHERWTNVLQAKTFGPQCLQVTTLGPFAGPANANEDCLYLNVYTPNIDPAAKESLPVIVWIHGGGNLDGASDGYDGTKMAADGHTVVVTINYRLGLLGFLAHPALDAEGHLFANYGILDQQAVLRWVKRNIGQFGGDKNNVTLGGQSAGCVDTESNMMSPLSAGLFHRAILQSVVLEPAALPTAEAKGTAFSVAAGCGSGTDAATAKCLRSLTAQQIFTLSGTASTAAPYTSNIIQDGQILPSRFVPAIQAGQFNHVPVMTGTTVDEQNFGLGITEYFKDPRVPASEADYNNRIAAFGNPNFPPGTEAKAKSLYPLFAYSSPQLALDAIGTDSTACTQRHTNQLLSSQVPVYMYEFDDRTAPTYFPKMPGFQALAMHTADIQYLFPLWHGGNLGIQHELNKKQTDLSDELVTAWTNFAWTGNPNGIGNSPWPRYKNKPDAPGILSENIPVLSTFTDAQYNAAHKCDFWDSISTY